VKQSKVEQMFEDWLGAVPESVHWTKSQIKALIMLDDRMLNVLEPHGLGYDGFSWRPGIPYGTLCVKLTYDSMPYVSFVTGKSLSLCVAIFGRMLRESRLVIKPDRFRAGCGGSDKVIQ